MDNLFLLIKYQYFLFILILFIYFLMYNIQQLNHFHDFNKMQYILYIYH